MHLRLVSQNKQKKIDMEEILYLTKFSKSMMCRATEAQNKLLKMKLYQKLKHQNWKLDVKQDENLRKDSKQFIWYSSQSFCAHINLAASEAQYMAGFENAVNL